MSNSYFQFKQFIIHQDKCAMKVGTDGVLLGAWADMVNMNSVLDVGTGTGLIALMLAQRSNALIDAIDIDEKAYNQSEINIASSPWKNRINLYHISFQDYIKTCQKKYDLIISNPPFFSRSYLPADKSRAVARHNNLLPLNDLLICTLKRLNPNGKLAVILPFDNLDEFTQLISEKKLFIKRQTKVIPKQGKGFIRVLIEAVLEKKDTVYSELIIETEKRHVYTEEFIELIKDFYLAY